ncbi:hypothetical protein L4H29_002429 [Pseudomonas aeruginosa]|nr:hypothetical protein [Pseudomonas aeruginosa]
MDEPLFNELLESVKQADQIMQTNKLKELAAQYLANPSGTAGEDSEFRAAANPQAILGLIAEVERLRSQVEPLARGAEQAMEECDRLRAENDALRGALQAVQAEVDGNLRPLTRDLVNMVSGLKNGSHPNDIYEHCDEIERIIGAALEGAKQ